MGTAVILCFLIQTFQSPTGDRVTSSSLCFGNTYFTNMKYLDIRARSISCPASCIIYIHLYFQVSPVLLCHDQAYWAEDISPTDLLEGRWFLQLQSPTCPGILAKEVVRAREMSVACNRIANLLVPRVLPTHWTQRALCMLCARWWIASHGGDSRDFSVPARECFFTALCHAM